MTYDPSARYRVKIFDVEIPREGSPLLARVYQPQGPGPFPMLIDEHGGAWSRGDRTTDEGWMRPLAESGILVLAPEFRVGPIPYPAQQQDIDLAVRWFKANAQQLNGDKPTLGGLGISSGGQTVIVGALRPRDPRYSALPLAGAEGEDGSLLYTISMWPVIDPLYRYQWAKGRGNASVVAAHDGYFVSEETMIECSPVRMLERGEKVALPRILFLHGVLDENAPIDLVRRFAKLYAELGGDVTIEEFEGEGHGFGREPGPVRDRMFAVIKAFIQSSVAGKVAVA